MGRVITLDDWDDAELESRISCAWKKFMMLKDELTGKVYSLHHRMKLFQSFIGATVLYGSEAWSLTKKMEQRLLRVQRRMLRMVLGHGRRNLSTCGDEVESWVDWLKRTT